MNTEQRIDKVAGEMYQLSYVKLVQTASRLEVALKALAEAVEEIERLKSKKP